MRKRKETQILLTRHSESKNNLESVYSSKPENDKGLTKKGERWAKLLAKRLKGQGISIIYSSNLPRCLQTAKTVSKVIKKKIIVNKNFREPDMGKYELMKEKEIEKKFPKLAAKWFYGDASKVKAGETFKNAQKRVWHELEKLTKKHDGDKILIITHQAPIKFVVCKIFDSLKYFNKFGLNNASVTLIEKKGKKYKIKYLNDTSHLR